MEQMSLFEGEKKKTILLYYASRMTDMPKYYPDVLMKEVMTRIEKAWIYILLCFGQNIQMQF